MTCDERVMMLLNRYTRLIKCKINSSISKSVAIIIGRAYQSAMSIEEKPVEQAIRRKLESALNPIHLNIINESYMHNVPKGSETHFKVVCVSEKFENLPLIQRHRLVNSTLDYELKNGVHALSIIAKAPSQWTDGEKVDPSPRCLGGFGK